MHLPLFLFFSFLEIKSLVAFPPSTPREQLSAQMCPYREAITSERLRIPQRSSYNLGNVRIIEPSVSEPWSLGGSEAGGGCREEGERERESLGGSEAGVGEGRKRRMRGSLSEAWRHGACCPQLRQDCVFSAEGSGRVYTLSQDAGRREAWPPVLDFQICSTG